MSDNVVSELPVPVKDLNLVAFSPGEIAGAQDDLKAWCDAKVKELRAEQRELRANLTIATRNKWRVSGLRNAVRRAVKRAEFYTKMRAALDAGYLLVPDFDVNVFAIRTDRAVVKDEYSTYRSQSVPDQVARELPVGEGRYVSPLSKNREDVTEEKDSAGKPNVVHTWWSTAFQDPEFPVRAVKPEILAATERAMGLRIFDRIGLVQKQRRKDPIVVGQIFHKHGYQEQAVNFFIAWWLDTRSL